MQLSPQAIQDFKRIYKEEYGQDISDDQAREMGMRLVRVFMVILKVNGSPPSPPQHPPTN